MSDERKLLLVLRQRLVAMLRNGGPSPLPARGSLELLASEFEIANAIVRREWQALCLWQLLTCRLNEFRRKGIESEILPPPPPISGDDATAGLLQELYKSGCSIEAAEKRILELRSHNQEIFAIWDEWR